MKRLHQILSYPKSPRPRDYLTRPYREISPGVTALAEYARWQEMLYMRDQGYEDVDLDLVGRRFLVFDGTPAVCLDSRAREAFAELLFLGRAVGVHVVLVVSGVGASSMRAEIREQFGVRVLGSRVGGATRRMVVPEHDLPSCRVRGRVHLVTPVANSADHVGPDAEPVQAQSLFLTEHEARALSVPTTADTSY